MFLHYQNACGPVSFCLARGPVNGLGWLPEIEAADGRRFNLSELLLYGTQACRGHWSPIRGIKVDSPRAGLAEDDEL